MSLALCASGAYVEIGPHNDMGQWRVRDYVIVPLNFRENDAAQYCRMRILCKGELVADGSFCNASDYMSARQHAVYFLSHLSSMPVEAFVKNLVRIESIGDFCVGSNQDDADWLVFVRGDKAFYLKKRGAQRNIISIAKAIDETLIGDEDVTIGKGNVKND